MRNIPYKALLIFLTLHQIPLSYAMMDEDEEKSLLEKVHMFSKQKNKQLSERFKIGKNTYLATIKKKEDASLPDFTFGTLCMTGGCCFMLENPYIGSVLCCIGFGGCYNGYEKYKKGVGLTEGQIITTVQMLED